MMETPSTSPSAHPNLRPEPTVAATAWSPSNVREVFLKRVAEYASQGLKRAQFFESIMTAVQADLFRDASQLGEDVNQMLVGGTTVPTIFGAEAITSPYLRVTRQIARNAQLEIRSRCIGLAKRSGFEPRGR